MMMQHPEPSPSLAPVAVTRAAPRLSALLHALEHHTLVCACAPHGYDQASLCRDLTALWPHPVTLWPQLPQDEALLLAELDALPTEQQQTLATWLLNHPEQPALLVSAPCSAASAPVCAASASTFACWAAASAFSMSSQVA